MLGSDPDVTPRFGSGAIPAKGGSGYNTYQYQNAEVDRLLAEGARQFDLAQRKTTYGDLQKLIRDDLADPAAVPGFYRRRREGGAAGLPPQHQHLEQLLERPRMVLGLMRSGALDRLRWLVTSPIAWRRRSCCW